MANPDVVTVERVVHAPAERIFDLLADPTRHQEFDGSGTVRAAKGESQRLAKGDRFGMSMKMGLPYSMENSVIEFEENRLIAWRTTGPGSIGRHFGGREWRYELEPTDDGTLVRESWDITGENALMRPIVRKAGETTRKNMAATLDRLEERLATPPDDQA